MSGLLRQLESRKATTGCDKQAKSLTVPASPCTAVGKGCSVDRDRHRDRRPGCCGRITRAVGHRSLHCAVRRTAQREAWQRFDSA